MANRHERRAVRPRSAPATAEQLDWWAELVEVCAALATAPGAAVGKLNRLAKRLSNTPVPGYRPGAKLTADDPFIRLLTHARRFAGRDGPDREPLAEELGRLAHAAAHRQAEVDAWSSPANAVRARADIFG